jgi:integrase
LEILASVPKLGEYVFTSSGNRPFENFSRLKRDLDSKIASERERKGQPNILSWTIHDLRRTCASGMARLGVAPHVIEKALNHTSGKIRGVAAIYNRYEYATEMKEAFTLWEQHITQLINENKSLPVFHYPDGKKTASKKKLSKKLSKKH